jgi:hypothetical protein
MTAHHMAADAPPPDEGALPATETGPRWGGANGETGG